MRRHEEIDRGAYSANQDDRIISRDITLSGVRMEREDMDSGFPQIREESYAGKGPKGWKRSDERIKEDACDALYLSPDVDASEIEVKVIDNCIFLQGSVPDRFTKRLAEQCVEEVEGVDDIRNELHIKR
jgi:osmotically-inducible protein OsmY